MTPKQKRALKLLCEHGPQGVVTSDPTALIDRQPWINWQTAEALERRGLVTINGSGDEAIVELVPTTGREANDGR